MTIILWQIFEALITTFQSFILVKFVCDFNGFEIKSKKDIWAYLVFSMLLSVSINLCYFLFGAYENVSAVLSPLLMFIMPFLIVRNSILKKIFGSVLAFSINGVVAALGIWVFAQFASEPGKIVEPLNIYRFTALIMVTVFLFLACNLTIKIFRFFGKKLTLSKYEWVALSLILIVSITIMLLSLYIFLSDMLPTFNAFFVLLIVMIALLNGTIVFILLKLNSINTIKTENTALKITEDMQKINIENMHNDYVYIRTLKHDMKNFISVIYELQKNKEYEKANDMLLKYRESIEQVPVYISGQNTMLVALFNIKISKVNELGFKFSFVTEDIEYNDFEDIDLCRLFGNLIDNAIEACEKCQNEPHISIVVKYSESKRFLNIKIENSVNTEEYSETLKTTKEDKEHHGFGMKAVQRIVNKYNGNIDYFVENNTFKIIIVLQRLDR